MTDDGFTRGEDHVDDPMRVIAREIRERGQKQLHEFVEHTREIFNDMLSAMEEYINHVPMPEDNLEVHERRADELYDRYAEVGAHYADHVLKLGVIMSQHQRLLTQVYHPKPMHLADLMERVGGTEYMKELMEKHRMGKPHHQQDDDEGDEYKIVADAIRNLH